MRLLFAILIGYLVFAEVPGWHTLAGAAVIIGSSLYTVHREAVRGRTETHGQPRFGE